MGDDAIGVDRVGRAVPPLAEHHPANSVVAQQRSYDVVIVSGGRDPVDGCAVSAAQFRVCLLTVGDEHVQLQVLDRLLQQFGDVEALRVGVEQGLVEAALEQPVQLVAGEHHVGRIGGHGKQFNQQRALSPSATLADKIE